SRNRFARLSVVAGHVHARSEASYRWKKDTKEQRHGLGIVRRLQTRHGFRRRGYTRENRRSGQGDEYDDQILSFDGERRRNQRHCREKYQDAAAHQAYFGGAAFAPNSGKKAFREANDVKANTEGEADEQRQPQGAADRKPQASRDDVIGSAGAYRLVGSDGGNTEAGAHRNYVSN